MFVLTNLSALMFIFSLLESSVPGVSEAVKAVLQSRVSKLKKFESKGLEVVLKLLEN